MSGPAPGAAPRPGIEVVLANAANARLLQRLLGDGYRLHGEPFPGGLDRTPDTASDEDVDLIIVDNAGFRRCRERILERRNRIAPLVLPVLLVADSRIEPLSRTTAELGLGADDILRIPTSRAELLARIDNLLRLRSLSRRQEESRKQLGAMVSALHTLNACDAIVVRSKTERELIESLCRTIVEEAGYSLAWIGFATGRGAGPVEVQASAGKAKAFIEELEAAWVENPSARGGIAQAIRTGEVQVVPFIADDDRNPRARDRAMAHGLAAGIALPLRVEPGPHGCLAIYSGSPGHFDRDARQLLARLAANLEFGLGAMRTKRDRERQTAEIHDLAYTDALTGLPNRRHLVQYLDGRLGANTEKPPSGAVLFIDLDGFKIINDALGHDVGDQVLRQVAQRLKGAVRDTDLIVRQGGDEFLVVLFNEPRNPNTAQDDFFERVDALADRIIRHLGEPLAAGGHEHRIGASIGISLYPEHACDAARLIEFADTAMYEAKKAGKSRAHLFTQDIASGRQQRLSMQSRLRHAIDRLEFDLHYQPIFELETRKVVAAEALIRWPQADGSMLMPGAFLPLVEEIALMRPLGDWVLDAATRQLRRWHEEGFELDVAVNVSLQQLYPDVDVGRFAKIVSPHVAPSRVQLELTESALMTDPDAMHRVLTELKEAGFQLAIDDFGTGFSSLSRLQHLPVHALKIDRSFVNELGAESGKGKALVSVICQMARSLGLQTVAEGIETDDVRRELLGIGPGYGQGYWFSRPLPASELTALLRA